MYYSKQKVKALVLALIIFVCGAFVFTGGQVSAGQDYYSGKPAKYVFLFIGDGMGIPHRQAPEIFLAAREGKTFGHYRMMMNTFPSQGVTTTYANDRFIIGSAASATAMSTGYTTKIGFIGMDPELQPVKTVAEMARDRGMKVGIVSSVSIDHATPAAFYAHQPHRSMYHEIAHELANSGFHYFGGGGFQDPEGKKSKSPKGDALAAAKNNGYTIVSNRADFMKLTPGKKVIAYNANLPDGKALPYAIDAAADDISLAEFTARGIDLLDNPNGFFMMVEGGKIDWASHANDAVATIYDTLAFDDAVKKAVEFAEKNPDETLIVVTGDHECGGLTLGFAGTKYESAYDVLKGQKISFQVFASMVKEYREKNAGKTSFDDFFPLIEQNFGLKMAGDDHMALQDYELKSLKDAFLRSMAGLREKGRGEDYLMYGDYEPLAVKVTHILNQKAGLAWTSYSHTGAPVTTSAMGVGNAIFNGYYHQSELGKKIMSTLGFSPERLAMDIEADDFRLAANLN